MFRVDLPMLGWGWGKKAKKFCGCGFGLVSWGCRLLCQDVEGSRRDFGALRSGKKPDPTYETLSQ